MLLHEKTFKIYFNFIYNLKKIQYIYIYIYILSHVITLYIQLLVIHMYIEC